jgi:hypothetical protein
VKHARDFAIVALLALGVWALPGGGAAADVFGAALFVVITIGVGLMAARFYRDNRSEIYGLGDNWRLLLYGALGVIILAMAATPKLFDTGAGTLLWLVLIGASIYTLVRVFRHSREY